MLGGMATVAVRAKEDICAGTSLRLRYGELSNEELLLRYGFVLYDNPVDRLTLPPGALAYALQASVESFQRALALNETQDFLSEADAKKLSSAQVSQFSPGCRRPLSALPPSVTPPEPPSKARNEPEARGAEARGAGRGRAFSTT